MLSSWLAEKERWRLVHIEFPRRRKGRRSCPALRRSRRRWWHLNALDFSLPLAIHVVLLLRRLLHLLVLSEEVLDHRHADTGSQAGEEGHEDGDADDDDDNKDGIAWAGGGTFSDGVDGGRNLLLGG